MTYVPLHLHTEGSLLDGIGKVQGYAKEAKSLGLPALAVTDHGNLYQALDFYDACVEEGIKPILGQEFYQARKTRFDQDEEERSGSKIASDELGKSGPYHLTVLAKNQVGYRNLVKLSSEAFLSGFYDKPRMDYDLLDKYREGLIVLSGCLNGEIQRYLTIGQYDNALAAARHMQEVMGKDSYFIEIQRHGIEAQEIIFDQVISIAREIDASIVPTGDCHYVRKEDATIHDLVLCMQTAATINDEKRFKFHGPEFYLKSYEEMSQLFPQEWLENTLAVADQVNIVLSFGEFHFPEFELPAGETLEGYLEKQVWAGINVRYGSPSQKVIDRARYELDVVKRMGFCSYFLIVSDILNWARNHGVRLGPGRGSAAGSVLSYALKITDLDPFRFDLPFERFLVDGRKSYPDIDMDMDDRYREKVIDYARQKYGFDRVAHISTFANIKSKQAIRDAARVLGYDYIIGDKLSKLVPPPVLGVSKTIDEALHTKDMRKEYDTNPDAKLIIDSAKGLEGLWRQQGIHAAGVVIAKSNITDYVPVFRKGLDKPVITQWSMKAVERCGLLKMDFLALTNLSMIDRCLIAMAKDGINLKTDDLNDFDDEATYTNLREGQTVGIFQLESGGMTAMSVAMQPDRIEDIMALIALYRPGPLDSGIDKMYIARKHGQQRITYEHPKLKDVLHKSYGLMLYQDDVLAVSRHLAGFTAAEADELRDCIGKKKMDKIGGLRSKFVEGCVKTNKVDRTVANKIFSDIEFYGGYAFNLAHAASYAVVSYYTAYLKTHYPSYFMAAVLSAIDDKSKMPMYLNECRRIGIKVTPPSINKSEQEFTVISDTEISFGLLSVDGIGEGHINAVMDKPADGYHSLYDFMRRCNLEVLRKNTMEHLARAGAFDELIPPQKPRLISQKEKMMVLQSEKDELGLYVSDHPLASVWHMVEPSIDTDIGSIIDEYSHGDMIKIAGLISRMTKKTTKKGQPMMTMVIEDLTGSIEVVVFAKTLDKLGLEYQEGDIVLATGRLRNEGSEEHQNFNFILMTMEKPMLSEYITGTPIVLSFNSVPSAVIIEKISKLIEYTPGSSPVYLQYRQGPHTISLAMKKPTSISIQKDLELLVYG